MVREVQIVQTPRSIRPARRVATGSIPAGDVEVVASAEAPDSERVISDPETLRAIADPTRIAILETMVTRANDAWSVKELAAALGMPQTRLYHHIELLVERDLIRAAGRRLVSGIVETRYRLAALTLRLDPHLFASEAGADSTAALIGNILDAARGELIAALRALPPDADDVPDRPLVTRGLARLTPERAAELRRRLVALLEEFEDGQPADAKAYAFLVALYPATTAEASTPGAAS
jgi:DNA-binding transcriptional ArsR family regulator